MKTYLQPFWSVAFAFALLIGGNNAIADTASDTEILLNWAENAYPDLFPSRQGTQTAAPWIFRFYPETGIYAGVNTGDLGVYVLGGPWAEPTYVDSLAGIVSSIEGSGGNSSIAACDTSAIPAGLNYSQSGNTITVTTDGCITIPNNYNFCEVPEEKATATGISVLSTTTITSSTYSGITFSFPIDLQSLLNSNTKICTINAPNDFTNTVINANICVDVTNQLGAIGDLGGFATITPPVTFSSATTSTNTVVSDCFATDASTIVDAVTDETWINQNGSFVKL